VGLDGVGGRGGERAKISILISLFHQQQKVKCQTERNAKIKFDKDTRKIKINPSIPFHGSYVVAFCKG